MKKLLLASLLALTTTPALADDACTLPDGYKLAPDTECELDSPLIAVVKTPAVGYANHNGKLVLAPAYEEGYNFEDGLALVKQKGKYGFINTQGKFVISPTFEDAWSFDGGLAKVQVNDKFGFINTQGKFVVNPSFDSVGDWFFENLNYAKKGDKYGFIDKTGKTKIPFTYDYAESFSDGLAVVGRNTGKVDGDGDPIVKYGYVDTQGKVVINLIYDDAYAFDDGVAAVLMGDKEIYINKQGKKVKNPYE